MKIRVLGCSGGIGGSLRTTSLLLDDDVLIDAGTGVADLSIEEMVKIDHIFLSHSHLDHVVSLPFLADTMMGIRDKHLTVHTTRATWNAIKEHILNWKIWPDFNAIPSESSPFLRYSEICEGQTVTLSGRKITALPAHHVVPATGFHLDSGAASLVFTGDTTTCDALWQAIHRIENLKYLLIETAYSNSEWALAISSKHLCPAMLVEALHEINREVELYITHLKPGEGEIIMREIHRDGQRFHPQALRNQQVFNL